MMPSVRIATRKSPLALWQSNFVKDLIQIQHPEINVELLPMLTTADKMFATPLNKIGGKGLFVKELEKAILEHRADIAVHSVKDMPAELPDSLGLVVVCKREDPRDVFVSNNYSSIMDLPVGAVLGTSSLRRRAQALAMRPDLSIVPLRGNIKTRLQRLDEHEFDAILLAAAGLKRLELEQRIRAYFSIDEMVPAAGQGAIGIECRLNDKKLIDLIKFLNNSDTCQAILAERTVNERLGGGCQFPIAAHAVVKNDLLFLTGMVSSPKGDIIIRTKQNGPIENARQIGSLAAEDLIKQGASELLNQEDILDARQ